jgi:FkbM family methyltransferase
MKNNAANAESIPRVIHRIWFGDASIPDAYEKYWEAWQRQYPDFVFRTWRDGDIPALRTRHAIGRAEGMARKADIARYEILFEHGGIYLDCDIFPLQRFDDQLLRHELVVCNETESDRYCTNSFIAAAPGSPALGWAVDTLLDKELNQCPANEDTGPWFLRRALDHGRYTRIPGRSFFPYLYNEPFSALFNRDLSETYGVHIWAGSWLSDAQKKAKITERLHFGDLEDMAQLASHAGSEPLLPVLDYCEAARAARHAALQAAKSALLGETLNIANKAPLEFVKAGLFLLSQDPQALVWQIGAADGILVDPLRALMVNFDPPAVLVEPNPYLFGMLTQNYRNNGKARLVNAALAEGIDKLVLNAINPEKVRARPLPDWVLGISSAYMDRNPIGGFGIDAETTRLIGECLERIEADVVGIQDLLDLHDGAHPALVVVDVEGMDTRIVELIMGQGIRPAMLQFECQWLHDDERSTLARLFDKEYVMVQFGNDVVAYRADFFTSYCDHLFIENGVHTIYKDTLKFMMKLD